MACASSAEIDWAAPGANVETMRTGTDKTAASDDRRFLMMTSSPLERHIGIRRDLHGSNGDSSTPSEREVLLRECAYPPHSEPLRPRCQRPRRHPPSAR